MITAANVRLYGRLLTVELDARRNILGWQRPQAMETLGWWLLVSMIFGGVWMLLGGYHAVFLALNRPWARVPDWLAQCITESGDTLFALVLLLFVARRVPQVVWLALLSAVYATIFSRGLKAIFDASRPGAVLHAGQFHLTGPLYYTHSFPSGHTVTAFTAAAAFAWFLPREWMRWTLFAIALLIGWSRVGVGAHWPLDVVAGMGLGTLSVFLGGIVAPRVSWGLSVPGHLLSVLALSGCAVAQLLRQPAYPLAGLWVHSVAVGALALTVWEYVVVPVLIIRDRRAAVPL